MVTITQNNLLIAFFDGIGEAITPTANFTPVSGYPLSNLTNSQLLSRTRTPDLTADRQLTFDWGSAIEHNVFMLAGTNATLSATRRIRDADNSGFTTGVVESGASLSAAYDTTLGLSRNVWVQPWGRLLIYVYPTSVTKRYTRWHQTDTSNPDGHMEWGIARVGLSIQFPFQSWRMMTVGVGSPKLLRRHEITLEFATRSEAYELQSLYFSTLGLRRVLVMPEPLTNSSSVHDAIWGVLVEQYEREVLPSRFNDKRHRLTLVFEEVDR
jgi:hypothetical protein